MPGLSPCSSALAGIFLLGRLQAIHANTGGFVSSIALEIAIFRREPIMRRMKERQREKSNVRILSVGHMGRTWVAHGRCARLFAGFLHSEIEDHIVSETNLAKLVKFKTSPQHQCHF